jgi:hypothetical protein
MMREGRTRIAMGKRERIQDVGRIRPGNVSKRVSGNEAIE